MLEGEGYGAQRDRKTQGLGREHISVGSGMVHVSILASQRGNRSLWPWFPLFLKVTMPEYGMNVAEARGAS